jgi:hypothetical protein
MIPLNYQLQALGAINQVFLKILPHSPHDPTPAWIYLTLHPNNSWILTASSSNLPLLTQLFEIALELPSTINSNGISPSNFIPPWEIPLWESLQERSDLSHHPFKKDSTHLFQDLKNNDRICLKDYHF